MRFLSVFLQSDLNHNLSVYRDLMLPVLFYGALVSFRRFYRDSG